jgi:rod shape-determining protein MreC
VTPFERVAHAIGSGVRYGWQGYIDLRHVRQQNQDLQQQLTRMRIEQASIAEDALQGRRLQALLAFKEQYVGSTVAAQIIGESGSDTSHVLTIDKGWRDGLRPDMPVITPDGIVGKLRDVFPTTSEVLEIDDLTSGAGVILATTRIRAILRGTLSGRVEIGNLTADSRIKPGEQVLTSGGDQVITGTQPNLPPDAQQDLAAAEAQHAADLSAERLPSIHDSDAGVSGLGGTPPATAAAPNPSTPPVLVIPHPLPAVHPDRFTSGSTPPASDLKPGGPNSPQNIGPPSSPPSSLPGNGKPASPQASPQPNGPQ